MIPKWISLAVFIGVLILYPYCFVLASVLPGPDLFGKNFYISAVTLLLAFAFVAHLRQLLSEVSPALLVSLMLLSVMIVLLRGLLYSETLNSLIAARFPVTAIIYFGVARIYTLWPKERRIVRNLIVASAVVQSVFGIVHLYFFPYVLTNPSYGDSGDLFTVAGVWGGRESGTLISSNLYGNFILLGIISVLSGASEARPVSWPKFLLVMLMMWGLLLSGSRLPVGIAIVFLSVFFVRTLSVRSLVALSVTLVIFAVYLNPLLGPIFDRMFAPGARVDKNLLAMGMLMQDPTGLIFGVSTNEMAASLSASGNSVSDNSFLLLSLCFGVPFCLIWTFGFVSMIKRLVPVRKNVLLLFYLALVLWLTNAIIWDIWVLYFFGLMFALEDDEKAAVEPVPSHRAAQLA